MLRSYDHAVDQLIRGWWIGYDGSHEGMTAEEALKAQWAFVDEALQALCVDPRAGHATSTP
jgi:hypothetical protein